MTIFFFLNGIPDRCVLCIIRRNICFDISSADKRSNVTGSYVFNCKLNVVRQFKALRC